MMTQEEAAALRPAGARLRLLWQTSDGAFALVERVWSEGDVGYGIIRRDGLWLQVQREFLEALARTVAGPAEVTPAEDGEDGGG